MIHSPTDRLSACRHHRHHAHHSHKPVHYRSASDLQLAAYMMSAAYYDEANIQRVVPAKSSYAYVDKSFFSGSTGVNRFLASKSSEARVVVAFRGTDYKSEKDVLADINILMPPWPYGGGGTVHAGFLGQYTEQRSDLLSRMQAQFGAGNRNWLVTGHSLGGALATIAARDLKAQFPSATVDLIVFGN
jgi:hypothetical protein